MSPTGLPERRYEDTPWGRMPVWHPLLDARKSVYGRPFEVLDQHQLAEIVSEHIKPVDGRMVALADSTQLCWPTTIELYVFEGVLLINGVECGPMERACWAPVAPVTVVGQVSLAFAPAEDRSAE